VAGNNLNAAFGLDGPNVGSGAGFYENPAIDDLGDSFGSGIPLELANSFGSGQNDFFRRKSFQAHLYTALWDESIKLTAFHNDITSLTGLRQPPQLISNGGTVSWLPYLGGDYTGLLLVGYRTVTPTQGKMFNVAASVNYHFSETLHASLRYDFIHSIGNTTNTGLSAGGFVVNSLSLRLNKTF
jgi:hypothetical protein